MLNGTQHSMVNELNGGSVNRMTKPQAENERKWIMKNPRRSRYLDASSALRRALWEYEQATAGMHGKKSWLVSLLVLLVQRLMGVELKREFGSSRRVPCYLWFFLLLGCVATGYAIGALLFSLYHHYPIQLVLIVSAGALTGLWSVHSISMEIDAIKCRNH